MIKEKKDADGLWSGGSYVMMKMEEIEILEDFSGLFPINNDTLAGITDSIIKNGFDKSQPVTLWEIEKNRYILVDGHTRRKAAENASLKEIPATITHFNSLEDAKQYAFKRQALRRNLTQKEIFIAALNMLKKEKRDGTGRMVEQTSKELGVSPSTLVHAKTIANRASKDDINALINGNASINSIYQKLKNKKIEKESAVANKTNVKKTGKVNSKIVKPKTSSKTKLVSLKNILTLLKEHNEKNAIKIILERYKNLNIQDS
jgi:ParB-like chromosome segregation protein Spo0J